MKRYFFSPIFFRLFFLETRYYLGINHPAVTSIPFTFRQGRCKHLFLGLARTLQVPCRKRPWWLDRKVVEGKRGKGEKKEKKIRRISIKETQI